MKTGPILAVAVLAIIVIGVGVYMIDVDQTEEGALPEVTVESGNMPEYDTDVGDVEMGETDVTVPTLDVEPPEEDGDTVQN